MNGLLTGAAVGSSSVTASLGTTTAPPATVAVVATPIVTSLSPTQGPSSGGNAVILTGSAFSGATGVAFGTRAATFVVESDTRITAVAPAGSGVVDVTVSGSGFTSARSAADRYTWLAPPTGTTVVPNQGPSAGGTQVTLTGTALAGATSVTVGGSAAIIRGTTATTVTFTTVIFGSTPAAFGVISDTVITVITPASGIGPADVQIDTTGGSATAIGAYVFF